jgi:ArsR family transcriptional regulator, arsenate/arsenite/antimonite-responsive transcriptional repressor
MELEQTALRLKALGNATRLEIYRHLVRAGLDGLPVGAIQSRTGVARSTLSHHLHRLIAVDLVTQERRGTTLICRANYVVMYGVIDFLGDECCADAGIDAQAHGHQPGESEAKGAA